MDNYEKVSKVSNKPAIHMYEQLVLLYEDCICACCKVFKIWWQVFYAIVEMVILVKRQYTLALHDNYYADTHLEAMWVVYNSGIALPYLQHT